jgi:hypothetical protein
LGRRGAEDDDGGEDRPVDAGQAEERCGAPGQAGRDGQADGAPEGGIVRGEHAAQPGERPRQGRQVVLREFGRFAAQHGGGDRAVRQGVRQQGGGGVAFRARRHGLDRQGAGRRQGRGVLQPGGEAPGGPGERRRPLPSRPVQPPGRAGQQLRPGDRLLGGDGQQAPGARVPRGAGGQGRVFQPSGGHPKGDQPALRLPGGPLDAGGGVLDRVGHAAERGRGAEQQRAPGVGLEQEGGREQVDRRRGQDGAGPRRQRRLVQGEGGRVGEGHQHRQLQRGPARAEAGQQAAGEGDGHQTGGGGQRRAGEGGAEGDRRHHQHGRAQHGADALAEGPERRPERHVDPGNHGEARGGAETDQGGGDAGADDDDHRPGPGGQGHRGQELEPGAPRVPGGGRGPAGDRGAHPAAVTGRSRTRRRSPPAAHAASLSPPGWARPRSGPASPCGTACSAGAQPRRNRRRPNTAT